MPGGLTSALQNKSIIGEHASNLLSHGPPDPPPNILSASTSGLIREVRADSTGAKSQHGCEYSGERVPFSSHKKKEKDIQAKKVKRTGQMSQVSTG
jgi:hypothetical protein